MDKRQELKDTVFMLGRDLVSGINDPASAAAAEYAIACALARAAEDRKDLARNSLQPYVQPYLDKPGVHVIVDSPHVKLVANVVRGGRRLNEHLLLANIMQQCNVDYQTACEIIESSKVEGNNQVRLTAVRLAAD